jgi:hypothetical protein
MGMLKWVGRLTLLIGMAGFVQAALLPEIDPGSGISALVLLSGAILVMRARRK